MKLALSGGLSVLFLGVSDPWIVPVGTLIVLALHLWAEENPWHTVKACWKALPLTLGIALVHATSHGLESGMILIGRFCLLLWAAYFLGASLTLGETIRTFEKVFRVLPLRFIGLTARDAALMLAISVRFFFLFGDEMRALQKAQKARAYLPKRMSLGRRIKHSLNLMEVLFHCTLRRADQVTLAMEARSYRPGLSSNHLARKPGYKFRPKAADNYSQDQTYGKGQ